MYVYCKPRNFSHVTFNRSEFSVGVKLHAVWDQLYAQFMSFFLLRLSRKAPQSSKIDPPAPIPLPKKQRSPEHHTPTMEEKIKPDVATKPDRTARKGVKPLRREE